MSRPERIEYDEFGLFHENAEEFGLSWAGPPVVRREAVDVGDGRQLSALVWGAEPASIVLLHGGAQNAHTWDTVALALDRPLVAIDLPGHGHSDGGRNGSFDLAANADDIATVVRALTAPPVHLVGMSLGGMTSIAFVDRHPDLVQTLTLVDVTPGITAEAASHIVAFVGGPESFADFDEILARTVEFNPTRSVSSLRRGILHNAVQRDDGSWVWRYARFRAAETPGGPDVERFTEGWEALARSTAPLLLARGMRPGSVLTDHSEEELRRRRPDAQVLHFDESGHSIQGDQPVELAAALSSFWV